jgi:hypothetical protein
MPFLSVLLMMTTIAPVVTSTIAAPVAAISSTIIAPISIITAMTITVHDVNIYTRVPRISRRTVVITIIGWGIFWTSIIVASGFDNTRNAD